MPWAVAAAAIGAGASLYGSSQASGASKDASSLQLQQQQQTRQDLAPYAQGGYGAMENALALTRLGPTGGGPDYVAQAAGMVPGKMTQAELEATPGYQFDLAQGLKAVQSAAAARGLGVSGASLKGAGSYATGLANKTYLDQFNIGQKRFEDTLNLNVGQQAQITGQANRLQGLATIGQNAATGVGTTGATSAAAAGNYLNQAGQADAAGTTGVNNALTGAANSYLANQNYQKLLDRYGSQGSGSQLGGYDAAAGSGSPGIFETGNYAYGG